MKAPTITHDIAKEQWLFISKNTAGNEDLIAESMQKNLYPLTLMAEHRMLRFVACNIIPYHTVLLGSKDDQLSTSWFNTEFAPQFINPAPFEFVKTFTEADAETMGTDMSMIKPALDLIQIAFPGKFTIELVDNRKKEGGAEIFFSAKY